jgi:hypothetical protein
VDRRSRELNAPDPVLSGNPVTAIVNAACATRVAVTIDIVPRLDR